jgi:hypothetical protein
VEPDQTQHDRAAAYVIAQLYSFASLISLRFHSRTEKLGARFKTVISIFTFFLNCVSRGESVIFTVTAVTTLNPIHFISLLQADPQQLEELTHVSVFFLEALVPEA